MKRIIFTLLMVVSYMLTSHAANIFTISDVQGRPGEEVTVSVSLDNSDAVSAVDMTIPLDRQLTYVDGSCVLNSSRANGHLITAGANNTELRVVIYDLNTNALKGESGELFSFKLRLKKEPQTYTLTATTVLGNATGGNLHSSVEPGSVTILSPKFTVITTKVDYGHIPIRSTYTQNITIQNSGNERLEVSGVAFSAKEFSTDETLFSVEAGDTKDITINYAPVSRGAISETVTFISNAINGKQKATLVADPFSVNELHVGSASGISDEEVTISLTMNNMEPIVGMSCDFTLPEQLVYVDDSFTASSRAGNLLATSQVNGNKLTLVLYSLNSKVIEGNDGEIATFKVRLNGTSGWYELYPEKVVLSNTTAENMTSATSSGVVQIQSPTISCVDELNMGDNPITELSKAPYKIYNYGEATLTISKVTFLAEGYSIAEQLPISIEPWQEQEITIEYKPTAKGRHSTIMQIYSNDPQNRMKSVEVTGSIHEPNNITVEGDFTENGYDLRVSLENYTEVVALQMDIHWIPQVVANEIKPTDRLNGLSTSITPIGNGVYRVILFSLDNTPISGHSGEIFTISYTHDNEVAIDNSVVTFDNMVFSSKNSENMSSQEAFSYTIPARKAQSITLDRTEVTLKANETTTLTATILPETTTIKDVVWSSSDESVVTVENGVVTAQQVGTATITVSTTDGTNLSASCSVEVVATPAESITLDRTEVTLKANETTTLTATILPETTTIKDVEWKSSDESVATVENGVVTAHQVGTATITVSTTDGTNLSASCEVKVVATPAESIALDRTEVTLKATETTTLTVTILPETTTIKDVVWSSSDESVATVENGVVTAHQVGTATITVSTTDGTNLSASCFVEVVATPAESIALNRTEVTLKATETTTLKVTILPKTTTIKNVEWKSSDESVATVENGVVTAQQVGTATITATTTDGTNLSASCFVEVTYTPAQSITLDKSIVMLQATETTTLTATILPETTTIKDVEWKSSDESVATVENGVVTAHQVGTATITATTTDGTNLSASCFVEVIYTPAQSITLDKTSVTLNANETTTLKFMVQPEGTAVRNIVWSSSNDGVATVDDGLVTAHNAGSATISVTATVGDENVWAAYYEGTNWGTSTVYAYVWDAGNGNYQHLGNWPGTPMSRRSDGKWYISLKVDKPMVKPMIIFNNGQGGGSNQTADLTFTNEGVYNYYGLQYDNSVKLSATCDVNVIANDVIAESIALDKTEVTLKATETTTLTATILPETTTIKDVVWSSSDESVATIENGVVTAHKVGTATITATTTDGSNLSANCIVTVEPTPAENIALDKTEVTLKATETTTLMVTILPETTTIKDVVWSSSDESVATVENGVVTAHKVGTATITATTTDGSNLSASCFVEVVATPAESIALDRTEVTLKANETTTLTATILPETTTIKDVEWKSSDESVATVENGVVTAHQVGTATITVSTTDGTNLSASCEVTVVATPAESIVLDKTEVTLKANETTTLTPTILPETTTIKDVEWKSSDESVATVENGVVTAHQVGTATITATTTDGSNLSANCIVTVEPTLAEEIVLEPYEIVAIVGDTIELTATIYPKTVTEKAVLWTVSDETVAHIELLSNLCARVVVLREGVATIEVRTIDGTDLTATCTVNIYSHVNKVITDSEEVEYYDLGGLKVAHPSKGIYIVRQGQNVKKVVLK